MDSNMNDELEHAHGYGVYRCNFVVLLDAGVRLVYGPGVWPWAWSLPKFPYRNTDILHLYFTKAQLDRGLGCQHAWLRGNRTTCHTAVDTANGRNTAEGLDPPE